MRRLTILSVAYPLAPVRDGSPGGAEQVLLQLDRAVVAAGHHSIVIATHGSSTAGDLIETPPLPIPFDDRVRITAQKNTAAAIETACNRLPIDLVHLHGIDFYTYLPPAGVPALVTLHLPLAWYPPWALIPQRPQTWLHCVSNAQARTAPAILPLLPAIENGVDVDTIATTARKRNFALYLGRICPEKGVHLAIEAARRADIPLLIAGAVFPHGAHTHYFESEIAPHLGRACRFVGSVDQKQKRRLLAAAHCLLVPSLVEETSSLVARESLAAGTPVVAFNRGALEDVVAHGRTGFLVDSAEEMAARIADAPAISARLCRADARRRFSLSTMTAKYLRLYETLVRQPLRAAG